MQFKFNKIINKDGTRRETYYINQLIVMKRNVSRFLYVSELNVLSVLNVYSFKFLQSLLYYQINI